VTVPCEPAPPVTLVGFKVTDVTVIAVGAVSEEPSFLLKLFIGAQASIRAVHREVLVAHQVLAPRHAHDDAQKARRHPRWT
jgi:hypothetical protein